MNTTITIEVDAAEQELIDVAGSAVKSCNWIVGECASKWCEKYAAGRTDADFAELIGSSQQTVNYARRIYDRFYPHGGKLNLAWRHWKEIVGKPDIEAAIETLLLDDEEFHTFEYLMSIYRMQKGEPEPTTNLTAQDVPPKETQPEPVAKPTPKTENSGEGGFSQKESTKRVTQSTPAQEAQTTSVHSGSESPSTKQVVSQLKASGQQLDDKRRKKLAVAVRKVADEWDPPSDKSRFRPPTVTEVAEYVSEKGYQIDAAKFVDFYESKGWKVGRNPMKNWRAAVRNAASSKDGWCNKSGDSSTRTRDWSEYE